MTPQERVWDVVPGYKPLAEVFQIALNQSQKGKGKERHANDKPFLQQPIAEIGRMVGIGYNVGQAMKKGQEAMRLPDDRAQAELLGAMVYLASAYLLIGERMEAEKRAAVEDIPSPVSVCADCTDHCDQFSLYRTVCAGNLDAKETARAAFTPVQEEVAVPCHWTYQGSWVFVAQCGGKEYVNEGGLPPTCPYCGGRIVVSGGKKQMTEVKEGAAKCYHFVRERDFCAKHGLKYLCHHCADYRPMGDEP